MFSLCQLQYQNLMKFAIFLKGLLAADFLKWSKLQYTAHSGYELWDIDVIKAFG